MIQQYHTLKSKLPKYHSKKAQYQNTVNPHVPLNIPMILFSSYQLIRKIDGERERGRPRRQKTEVGKLVID